MPSDLDLMRQRVGSIDSGYQQALDRRLAGFAAITERNREDKLLRGKTREEKERFKREQAAQAKRDARLNLYDVQGTNQRAGIAADAAYNQQGYTMQRDKQQTLDQLKRDAAQQGYTLQRDAGQQRNQLQRDAIQQDYGVQNDERQFGYQAQRDARLQGYDVQNDERRFGQQVQRDATQQDYGVQNDERQFEYQGKRDERLQGYDVQNTTQRQTFELSTKLQDQITQARTNGLDFSADQKKERQTLMRAFQKHVMNNPDLSAAKKQKAGLILQQQLLGIIPDEPMMTPEQERAQTFHYDGEMRSWLKRGYDSQGRPDWEPIGSSGGGGAQAKEAQRLQQLDLERAKALQEITEKVTNARDPNNADMPLFQNTKENPDVIEKEVMRQFADFERIYTAGGNEPHPIFQHAAQKDREAQQKAAYDQWYEEYKPWIEQQEKDAPAAQKRTDKWLERQQAAPAPADMSDLLGMRKPTTPAQSQPAPAKQKPVTISSTNFDDQLKTVMDSGDSESAAALQTLKAIKEKFKGAPPEDAPEFAEMMRALVFLRGKGMTPSQQGKAAPRPGMYGSPQIFYNRGMR